MHVNFQNASPTFHHAIVMLLYLLPGNKQRGRAKVGQHSVLALPLAESLATRVKASYFSLAPSNPLSSYAELGGLLSLRFGASRHLTMGMFPPWVIGLEQITGVGN